MSNLFEAYIRAWADYKEEKFMEIVTSYLKNAVDSDDLQDLEFFHSHFAIKHGYYFGVDEDYAIGDYFGRVFWKGDYPTVESIRQTLEDCAD